MYSNRKMPGFLISALVSLVFLVAVVSPALGSTVYRVTYSRSGWYNTGYYSTKTGGYVQPRPSVPTTPTVPRPTPIPAPVPTPVPRPTPPPVPAPQPAPPAGLTAQEAQMLALLNQERARYGLAPLQVDARLVNAARMKSQDMAAYNYFSHTSPTYGSPFDMMRSAGISYRTAGENLAGAVNADTAHQALMNSPGHRANILNPAFTHVGIGAVSGSRFGMLFTQMFIGL